MAPCYVRFIDVPVSVKYSGTFRQVYSEAIVNNQERNRMIAEEALAFAAAGKTVLVQVKEIAHGEILAGQIGSAAWIHGKTHKDDRSAVKAALKDKSLSIAICSPIWDEGVDIPNLDAIVVATGGMSEIKSVQKVGRGLRIAEDKDYVEVIDFNDWGHTWLRKHSRIRGETYKERGWIVDNEVKKFARGPTLPRRG